MGWDANQIGCWIEDARSAEMMAPSHPPSEDVSSTDSPVEQERLPILHIRMALNAPRHIDAIVSGWSNSILRFVYPGYACRPRHVRAS